MNIIKSGEWELLSNFVRNEELNTVKFVLDFLTEETLRYENGEASYPRIDFAIAIALDRRSEEKRNQERLALKMSVPQSQPPVQSQPALKLTIPTKSAPAAPVPEPTTPELSPKSRREVIRNSWLMKFERDAQNTVQKPEEVHIPQKEPEKKEAEKKEPEKKEKIVKQESESESESEPEPPKPVKPVVKRIIRRRPIKKVRTRTRVRI